MCTCMCMHLVAMSASHHVRYVALPLIQLDPGTLYTFGFRVFHPARGEIATLICDLGLRFKQLMI